MKKSIVLLLSTFFALSGVHAQENAPQVSIGIAGGGHFSSLNFSELNKDLYPTSDCETSGLFSVFAEIDLLKGGMLGLRPQLSFLNRGGTLHAALDEKSIYDDVRYSLHAHYVDFRLPVMFQLGDYSSTVRPYFYVAPVVGFCTGGNISYEYTYPQSNRYDGYRVDLGSANMSSTEIAAQIGAGVKFAVPFGGDRCYLGVELAYEKGLSDTYGSKEIDHEAINVTNQAYRIKGTRKLDGFEAQAVFTVPLSAFKKKAAEPRQVVVVERTVEAPKPQPKRKPCYTLDEISRMISNGESVHGKKICAITDINFDTGKSTIKRTSYTYLNKLADVLIALDKNVIISGHTDNTGSSQLNEKLSKERANEVAKYLVKRGLDSSLITTVGYGDTQPIDDNNTSAGRAQNRRVEFDLE